MNFRSIETGNSDLRREPTRRIVAQADVYAERKCDCQHYQGRHAGGSRCVEPGCGCLMFRQMAAAA